MFAPVPRAIAVALCLIVAACSVDGAPPATLRAEAITAAPVLALRTLTPTPVRHTLPAASTVQQTLDGVASDRLLIVIDGLVKTGTRHVLSASDDPTAGIEGARTFLLDQFAAIHDAVPLTVWTQPVPLTLNGTAAAPENIVAVLQGTDINAGVIVIGAHYDTANSSGLADSRLPAPGANANASGVAALVEIARLMAHSPHRATLMFVAFAAEETGRQGSRVFVNGYLKAQDPPIEPRAMLNLDTIGSNTAPDGSAGADSLRVFSAEPNDSASRQLARFVQLAASAYAHTPGVIVQSSEDRAGHFGDQQSFSEAGDPAVRLIEGVEDPPRQRSARDTFDTIRPAYLMAVTRAALAALAALADGPDAPRGLALHPDGGTRRLTWQAVPGAAGYIVALRRATSLTFDQVVVTDAPQWSSPALTDLDVVTVAAFDANNRMGALAAEMPLAALAAP